MAGNPLLGNNPMMSMMQNNPLMQIINMAKSGKGNPMQLIQQFASQNPQMQQAMDMISGRNQSEINEIISKTAKERGVDLKQLADQLGIPESARKNMGIE